MRRLSFILAILILTLNFGQLGAAEIGNSDNRVALKHMLVDITRIDTPELSKFKSDENMTYWCELDNDFFISYKSGKQPRIPDQAVVKTGIFTQSDMSEPMLSIKRGINSPIDQYREELNIIYENGPYTIFQAPPNVFNEIAKLESNHFKLETLKQNIRVAVNIKHINIPEIKMGEIINVNTERLIARIKTLENFKTRYSYSEGYLKAANFAIEEFKKLGFEAKLVEYSDNGQTQYNVVAQKKPDNKTSDFYVVGGHLDSMSPNPSIEAPGADDNASGSAGVIEVATIISKFPFADKVRFVLFAGEELGLHGSKAYASQLKASGEIKNVLGMVNLDMIGFDKKPPISSLWQTKQAYDGFVGNFLAVAKQGGKLKVTMSYNVWGSDHVSFINAGAPSFLFIEDEYGSNPNYHQVTDHVENLNPEMPTEFVRVVAQGLVNILSAPAAQAKK
ncbi:MAG TPA: M28 family peptidase [Candidatus Wallbacteria bacterium]|nr:M28 family peptidase [Candidatus Wallbacteria bacterium]